MPLLLMMVSYLQAGDALETLLYVESETSYKHGKGQKSKSVVQIGVVSFF